jgi:hypothetical protein
MTQHYNDTNAVDLTLIIALDVSYSVDVAEYDLMSKGLAFALDSQEVENALLSGPLGAIQVCIVQWSGFQEQDIKVKWTRIASRSDLAALARKAHVMTRRYTGGATDISGALSYCWKLLKTAPAPSGKQVIDLAADGTNNVNFPPNIERDLIVADGITINGLAITNEVDNLVSYFENTIIGGSGAFVEVAAEYTDFEDAMRRKLAREMQILLF